jgi:alpha/beta superfamily hydrolase
MEPLHEEPFFFTGPNGRRLFAIHHRSGADSGKQKTAQIVFCHPLLEEKLNAHRIGVNFARRAAREGLPVLRFDYGGDGESTGSFEEGSVTTRVDDILAAAKLLGEREGSGVTVLVGLRFGALLALLAAERSSAVGGVVAWAPVLQGSPYFFDALRANLTTQMTVHKKILQDRGKLVERIRAGGTANVDGYEIAKALYEEAEGVDFLARPIGGTARVLAVEITRRPSEEPTLAALVARNRDGRIRAERVLEAEFWKPQNVVYPACEVLFSKTLDWIRAHEKRA